MTSVDGIRPALTVNAMSVPGQEELKAGDVVTLFIQGAQQPGFYKIITVRRVTSVATHPYDEFTCEWRADETKAWKSHSGFDSSDDYFKWIKHVAVVAPTYPNGCVCKRCNSRNKWAEPNQKDGTSYICYECR